MATSSNIREAQTSYDMALWETFLCLNCAKGLVVSVPAVTRTAHRKRSEKA